MAKKIKDSPAGLYLVSIVGIVAVVGLVMLVLGYGGGLSDEDLAGEAFARMARLGGYGYTAPITVSPVTVGPVVDVGLDDPQFVGIIEGLVDDGMFYDGDPTDLGGVDIEQLIEDIKQGFGDWLPPTDEGDCDYSDIGCDCSVFLAGCWCICDDDDDDDDFTGIVITEDIIFDFTQYIMYNYEEFNVDELKNLVVVQAVLMDAMAGNIGSQIVIP